MALIKWDPFGDLITIQEKMNKLFEDTMNRPGAYGADEELGLASWAPPVDIYETENEVVLKAELPEIDKEKVEIHVDNNILTLSGHRELEKETKKENYHRIERSYGSFKRSFTLPTTIDQEKIDAKFENGVLKISMPKREESKPRQIEIKK
ncbi:MAG: Hsp20/alpha crystallin family protein [Acidobacteria bacterium]|nr:Hsp20/alpha crystallin family protein [Acidobacteriota bacterium]